MSLTARLTISAVPGLPEVHAGVDVAGLIGEALHNAEQMVLGGDILVIAQKIVSKAEGRLVDLASVTPSAAARELAAKCAKDARLVEVVLSESSAVLRAVPGVLIVRHRLGFVMANAGVDRSNVDPSTGVEPVLLLPADPDASARRIRAALTKVLGLSVGVIIADSFGRAWRLGTMGVAIGVSGLPALSDQRGRQDRFGRPLEVTEVGLADEIAAAASLVMGQADEGAPVAILSGLRADGDQPATALVRPRAQDLFG